MRIISNFKINLFRFMVVLLLYFSSIISVFYLPFIFQEGNPIPIGYGIIKMSITGDAFVKIGENKYIVRSDAEDINKLTDYLTQNGVIYIEQMGAGRFFKNKKGEQYAAISRMYSRFYEVWDFGNQAKPSLALP